MIRNFSEFGLEVGKTPKCCRRLGVATIISRLYNYPQVDNIISYNNNQSMLDLCGHRVEQPPNNRREHLLYIESIRK